MPSDWKSFSPSEIPKATEEDNAGDVNVRDEPGSGSELGVVPYGPKKVFKSGYPTGKWVGFTGARMTNFEPMALTQVEASSLLDLHGVADSSKIKTIVHPAHLSLLASLIKQEAVLVTQDLKMIDVSAHAWPINVEQAQDARMRLKTPVRYGDELGIVAGVVGELVMFRSGEDTKMVPLYDLELAPGRVTVVAAEPQKLAIGDLVITSDGRLQGEVVGLAEWHGGSTKARVRWEPSGAVSEVDSIYLTKAEPTPV